MFKSVLREAIIKKDIFLQKSFTTRFHTSTFFSSKNQKKTVTKKGSQGGGSPFHQCTFHTNESFCTLPLFLHIMRGEGWKSPWVVRFSLHLLLDVIPGTRLGCGAWVTVIWESLEQSEMESAWRRFELRSKWIQSWRLIDVRARSSRYQYVQSENWNLEIGNKLLDR